MKWGFKRAFVRCALLFSVGAALQFIVGDVSTDWLKHPLGLVLAINYLYLLILLIAKADKWTWVKQLTDHHASVSSLASMLIMTIIFGLTGKFGPSSWPFCILLFYFITVLGLRAIAEVKNWRRQPFMAMIIHVTVFLVLAAAFFSSGDKQKVRVLAEVGQPVHTGFSSEGGRMTVLPFVLTLEDFSMELYPNGEPKTYLSHVNIEDKKGVREVDIMVNHPARVGAWKIYQVSYDKNRGAESSISIFECVKDGWYPAIRIGLWLILSAGVFMALTAGYKRKKEERI